MSRCCRSQQIVPVAVPQQTNNCICSLPTLVILILIVLQFSKGKNVCSEEDGEGGSWSGCGNQVGNGVLFIIALFFLSCAGCGRGTGAY